VPPGAGSGRRDEATTAAALTSLTGRGHRTTRIRWNRAVDDLDEYETRRQLAGRAISGAMTAMTGPVDLFRIKWRWVGWSRSDEQMASPARSGRSGVGDSERRAGARRPPIDRDASEGSRVAIRWSSGDPEQRQEELPSRSGAVMTTDRAQVRHDVGAGLRSIDRASVLRSFSEYRDEAPIRRCS
jgi:hypothetical protein